MTSLADHVLDALVLIHVAAGFVGLPAFWIPGVRAQGGARARAGRPRLHVQRLRGDALRRRRVGRDASSPTWRRAWRSRIGPRPYAFALFLGYLGVVTFGTVRHAIRVVETRKSPEKLRTPFHEALAWASMAGSAAVVAFALGAWSDVSAILLGLSPIGLFTGMGALRLMRNPGARRMGWFYSHLGSMLGGGIAFHTAFIVFGAQRLWAWELAGPLAVVPWVLPTAVGIPAIVVWTRYYRRKFGPVRGAAA